MIEDEENRIELQSSESYPIAEDQHRQVSSEVVPIAQLVRQRVGQLGAKSISRRPKSGPVNPSAPRTAAYRADDVREVTVPPDEASVGVSDAGVDRGRHVQPPLQIEAIITQFSHE